MTVAHGRMLYEIVDHSLVLGYVIPSDILSEAVLYGLKGSSLRLAWSDLSQQGRAAHYNAHRKALDQFPSIDPIASRLIVERLMSHGTHITRSNIEQAVVDHAAHVWTSYRFLLQQGEPKDAAIKAIKPRIREVLTKWLGPGISVDRLGGLWRRWKLLDTPTPTKDFWGERLVYKEMDRSRKRCGEELDTYYTPSAMTCYGGKETVGNLSSIPLRFS